MDIFGGVQVKQSNKEKLFKVDEKLHTMTTFFFLNLILYPIHTSKTNLVKTGFTQWKWETENLKTEFSIGFK